MTQLQLNLNSDGFIDNPTQERRVLNILRYYKNWVSGMYFLGLDVPITQYHARIWGLQKKGYKIDGRFIEGKNYKEYKISE